MLPFQGELSRLLKLFGKGSRRVVAKGEMGAARALARLDSRVLDEPVTPLSIHLPLARATDAEQGKLIIGSHGAAS